MVGMLFFGINQDEALSTRKFVMRQKIGQAGYVAVLGGKGAQKGH